MRNLILFLARNNFSLLFVVLEVLCIILLVQNNSYHRSGFINSSNAVSGNLLGMVQDVNDFFNLSHTNKELSAENALLHTYKTSSFISTGASHYTVSDTALKQKYEYISAKVVNNSTNRRSNYLTLDKGSAQGIKPNMAVISPSGVVGVVINVSKNFCSVMSVLHKDNKVSVKIKKDGSFGPLSWEKENTYNTATLSDIPNHVKLKQGDTVVTSAYSSIYPENIMIGTVEDFEVKSGESFFTIQVNLSTEFKKLSYVYIVNNIMKTEQDSLETKSQIDKKD